MLGSGRPDMNCAMKADSGQVKFIYKRQFINNEASIHRDTILDSIRTT